MTDKPAEIKHLDVLRLQLGALQTNFVRLFLYGRTTHAGVMVGENYRQDAARQSFGAEITLNLGGHINEAGIVSGGETATFDLLDVETLEPFDPTTT